MGIRVWMLGFIVLPDRLKSKAEHYLRDHGLLEIFQVEDGSNGVYLEQWRTLSGTREIGPKTADEIVHLFEEVAKWIKDTEWDGQAVDCRFMDYALVPMETRYVLGNGHAIAVHSGTLVLQNVPLVHKGQKQQVMLDATIVPLRDGRAMITSVKVCAMPDEVELLNRGNA